MRFNEIDLGSRGNRGLMFMREIKSNPSQIVSAYVCSNKRVIEVVTGSSVKEVKLTDIPIMDRYSNGSYIVKDKIINSYMRCEVVDQDSFNGSLSSEEKVEEPKKEQAVLNFDMLHKESLKEIDDRMIVINNFLDNIEGK